MKLWKAKIKAFSIHLVFSLLIITAFMLVVTQIWYPGPLFKLENVWQALEILIPVDAILGPILTLILFVPGKKGLRFDLWTISFFQVAALFYGGALIYQQRPAHLAFVVDRFEVITANQNFIYEIDENKYPKGINFPQLSYVIPAQSKKEKSDFIINAINISKMPERYSAIGDHLEEIRQRTRDLGDLSEKSTQTKKQVNLFLSKLNQQSIEPNSLIYIPLQSSNKIETILLALNNKSGKIIDYLEVSPW
jgi:hypothetical protein